MHLAVPPKTVLETILDWSKGRPMWQRDALRRIVTIGAPDALAINDILAICKKEHGEADISLTAMPLEAAHLPANPGNGASINLVSLGDFVGVNQLAQNQTLVFEQRGLTVVYGPNGAGKSGYGRVLKRACRARKAAEIMPNAYSQTAGVKAAARFTITRDGVQQPALTWQDDASPDPVLSAISVFDRECGAVHIQDKTEVAFRPFGLDIPDELATVCAMVKELLQAEETRLKALRDPVLDKPTWRATTEVGRLMSSLKHNSDLEPLSALANMTSEERARLQQLAEGLAKNPVEAAAEQLQFASGIARVRQYLKKVEQDYSDEVLGTLKSLAEDARTKRSAATIAAQGAFKDAALPSVGANVWRELWEAARHYSKHIEQQFPADEGEHCLLCHQPLTAEAGVRLGNFESFVRDDTERQAEEARNFFAETLSAFNSHQPNIRLVADVRRRIAVQRADVAARMLRFMAIADLRRRQCLRDIEHDGDITLHPMSEMPEAGLLAIESDLRAYAGQLEAAADVEGRRLLQAEHDELQDRSSATALYQVATKEVERLAKLERIGRCLAQTVTTPITKLGNELADDVITPRMRDRFQEEIVRLAAEKVRVEVVRSGGQYGSPSYQIRLFANARSKVHLVLSEGEQTCVALAAFLTELATATHKSALVFDDPVTSLDHRWRRKVAQRLVDEGKERQIIVFTHDLVFLNDLNDTAQDLGVPVKLANLSRGPDGTGVVADGLPWDHGSVRARLDKLEKDQRAAKALYDCGDEVNYHASARHLYGFLRATWERAVEEIVFAGVLMRHRDYIDTKTLKRVTALQEADTETFRSAYQKCNEIIDAHDPSRARNEEPPPPSEMADDIKALKDWADALRTRQNAVK